MASLYFERTMLSPCSSSMRFCSSMNVFASCFNCFSDMIRDSCSFFDFRVGVKLFNDVLSVPFCPILLSQFLALEMLLKFLADLDSVFGGGYHVSRLYGLP